MGPCIGQWRGPREQRAIFRGERMDDRERTGHYKPGVYKIRASVLDDKLAAGVRCRHFHRATIIGHVLATLAFRGREGSVRNHASHQR